MLNIDGLISYLIPYGSHAQPMLATQKTSYSVHRNLFVGEMLGEFDILNQHWLIVIGSGNLS